MRVLLAGLFALLSTTAAWAHDGSVTARSGPFPETKKNIHLEMVFNAASDINQETGIVDLVWGSYLPTTPPGMYNSSYMPFFVDNRAGFDVAWYQAHHADWLAYKCDRTSLAYLDEKHQPPLDFANPAVQAYQQANWIDQPLDAGYQSIAIDLLHLTNNSGRCGHFDGSQWVQEYNGETDQRKYRRDVLAWEKLMLQHIHAYNGTATMQVNVTYDIGTLFSADNLKLMTTADLLFDERGFTNWGDARNVPTPDEWTTIVAKLQEVQSHGLCYMTNGQEPGTNADITPGERQWVIGNYLLVRNNCTYMYMTGRQDYGALVVFPEYAADFGSPAGDMSLVQGAWERLYSSGLTLVNPYDATAVVDLPPGHWTDVDGNRVTSPVTLQHQTALLLLKVKH
jgi:hypothetical protein